MMLFRIMQSGPSNPPTSATKFCRGRQSTAPVAGTTGRAAKSGNLIIAGGDNLPPQSTKATAIWVRFSVGSDLTKLSSERVSEQNVTGIELILPTVQPIQRWGNSISSPVILIPL